MADFLNGKPVVLNTQVPFVLIGPNPGDPYHPDIPLIKSGHGSTEVLGFIRWRELGRQKPREASIEQVMSSATLPYRKVQNESERERATFVFAWRGPASRRGKNRVEDTFQHTLPDVIEALYSSATPNESAIEWAISQTIAAADASVLKADSLEAFFHPSQRARLMRWYLVTVILGSGLVALIYLFATRHP